MVRKWSTGPISLSYTTPTVRHPQRSVIRDGDRLVLAVGDAHDAVLPSHPTTTFLPQHEPPRPTEPGPGPYTYTQVRFRQHRFSPTGD
jgi:hypothetical protein